MTAPASRRRSAGLRERVLRAGARLIISARRMILTLSTVVAGFWTILWPEVTALQLAAEP